MKAVHVEVPGHPQGALALCFPTATAMGEFAKLMLAQAQVGNCNVCLNAPGQSQEQMALNVDMAAFEARCMPDFEVSRIEAPRASLRSLVAVPRRLGAYTPAEAAPPVGVSGNGGNGRPQVQLAAGLGKVRGEASVVQPWTKQGIPEATWRQLHGWPEKE